jgi:hypothetical protein
MELLQVLSAMASIALIIGVAIGVLQLRGLRAQWHVDRVLRRFELLAKALDTRLTTRGQDHARIA